MPISVNRSQHHCNTRYLRWLDKISKTSYTTIVMKIFDLQISQQQYMRLAKGNWRLPFWIFTPLAIGQIGMALFAYQTPVLIALALVVLGFLFWGVQEYALHRFPFHWNFKHGLIKFFTSGFHSLHHQVPQNKEYIVAPIYLALWGQLLTELFFYVITRDVASTHLLGGGLAVGYMYYEWVHYLCHHKAVKSRYYQRLKDAHLHHHFKTPKKIFGVSYPFWDYVFGTYVKPTTSLHQNPSQ